MQPLNHDMDDLMRRAAADYPVTPQGADWEKVAQQLARGSDGDASTQHGGLKKLLLLLPFIFAGFVCDRFLNFEYGHLKKSGPVKQAFATAGSVPIKSKADVVAAFMRPSNSGIQPVKSNAVYSKVLSQKQVSTKPVALNEERSSPDFFNNDKAVLNREPSLQPYEQANLSVHSSLVLQTQQTILPLPVIAQAQRITIAPMPIVKKSKTVQINKAEKVYTVLLLGPDFSRVKTQQVKPAGYSVGALAGYRFSKRLAVETGVLWDRKNYFSNGTYFKTDKLSLPEHTKVVEVDGYCAMFEIPLNVRYTVMQKKKNAVFLSAGISSYLMHNEYYDYVAQRYGTSYAGAADYKRASNNWFSIANLSFGYEHQVGAKTKIRIEPYLKIPVKGVGIGSLPLNSTGILIGITQRLH